MTDAEYEVLRAAAAARPGRGVSVARFVMEAALAAAGEPSPPPHPARAPSRLVLAEIADAVVSVNRVGNNLNQLAREKNSTGLQPVSAFAEVERALRALEALASVAESGGGRRA